jgi:hypothetical protein
MSHETNQRMIEVCKEIGKLDLTTKDDHIYWKESIESGKDVKIHELEEAERYLEILKEGMND